MSNFLSKANAGMWPGVWPDDRVWARIRRGPPYGAFRQVGLANQPAMVEALDEKERVVRAMIQRGWL